MSDFQTIRDMMQAKDVQFVDLRFTDPRGKWQHVTFGAGLVNEEFFSEGQMFDGSSIAGWKAINESDMVLIPDMETAVMDPFAAQPTMVLICDILEPSTREAYRRDPRLTAKRAETFLQQTGIGDTSYFGPEPEFFVFDDVRFSADPYSTGFHLDSTELPDNSDTFYEAGNLGHRPRTKGGYFPVAPVDSCQDLRSEMLSVMAGMGVEVEKHHHEVAAAQHELGIKFNTLTRIADSVQIYKYVVHNVAHSFGKTATFMPKPVFGDNGTGMHCHQSIWKGGKPLFAGTQYADLSETCLHYIGGIIAHAKAINAFTNPSTNSYKRLVPGFEAPVLLAYSSRNRSASCRIPYVASPNGKRVEVRFPDPAANCYYALPAMMLAGLDGIENRIDPGDPGDVDLYEEDIGTPVVPGNLGAVLDALQDDHDYLLKGGVFTDDIIQSYIEYKRVEEADAVAMRPHPYEFQLYLGC